MTPNSTSGLVQQNLPFSYVIFHFVVPGKLGFWSLMLFDATLTLLFVPAQQISPLSLVLFSFCCTRNPNFQIICTLSNGMLCYRSNNMCDFSTTKLNRELYLNRVTLPNNMYDFRGVVFCCTDCCMEISLVQQNERRVFI